MSYKDLAKPGDILLYHATPKSPFFDRIIGAGQLIEGKGSNPSQYYHISIVESINYELQASWPKTNRHQINWDNPDLELWRVVNVTDLEALGAIRWAQCNLGNWYAIWDFLFGYIPSNHSFICSTFCNSAYTSAGRLLLSNGFTPNEVVSSGQIYQIFQT